MIFFNSQHQFYCGIDLHARSMYLCIVNKDGDILLHNNIACDPELFINEISPYISDIVVGVECVFTWYWLADLCEQFNIDFILGHALYMKAISGGKTKNDKIDSKKIALLMKSGMFPMAYVYPNDMRSIRDLLRRRMYLVRHRAEMMAHIHNTNSQYNLPQINKSLSHQGNRIELPDKFDDFGAKRIIESDIAIIEYFDKTIRSIEKDVLKAAKSFDSASLQFLQTIPGFGKILSLTILLEIHDINRFPSVQNFASYARLVKCSKESGGKKYGTQGNKIGNSHLKWAFGETAVHFLILNPEGKEYHSKLKNRYGKARAMSILSHKLGRTAYYILKNKEPFSMKKFLSAD
jgi:transposase